MAERWEDFAFDHGLVEVAASADRLFLCRGEPRTFAAASASALAYAVPILSQPAPGAFPFSRKIRLTSVSAAAVTCTGVAEWWALADSEAGRLLVCGPLTAPVSLVAGGQLPSVNAFDLTTGQGV